MEDRVQDDRVEHMCEDNLTSHHEVYHISLHMSVVYHDDSTQDQILYHKNIYKHQDRRKLESDMQGISIYYLQQRFILLNNYKLM